MFFFFVYIKMLEGTSANCYKCNLGTIIDNIQYFQINLRDFEVETESKKRRELTPNIKFQAHRIFVKNNLFEQVIKKAGKQYRIFNA